MRPKFVIFACFKIVHLKQVEIHGSRLPDEPSQTIDFVLLCLSVNTQQAYSGMEWRPHSPGWQTELLIDVSLHCTHTFHSSRSKPRILLVCGHCSVKLPLDACLRLQLDCMHSFPPGGVADSLGVEGSRLNGKEEALTVCLGLHWARKAKFGGRGFLGNSYWWLGVSELSSNCSLLSLVYLMAAGAASSHPDVSGTCCPLSLLQYYLSYSLLGLCTIGKRCLRAVASFRVWPFHALLGILK